MLFTKPRLESLHSRKIKGEDGRPSNYPIPPCENDLLFYLQRNHNSNTVIYELNRLPDGTVNINDPINIFWIRYADGGERRALNFLQQKLIYGYDFKQINKETFELRFVACPKLRFFLAKRKNSKEFNIHSTIDDKLFSLNSIYAYADESGAFPSLKSLEFYGNYIANDAPSYYKINF